MWTPRPLLWKFSHSWCTPANKHNGRLAVKFGTYWSRSNFMFKKRNDFLQTIQMLMSLFQNGLWSLGGGTHRQALLDQLWSTVSTSLVVLAMLVMIIMVLVGIGWSHYSMSLEGKGPMSFELYPTDADHDGHSSFSHRELWWWEPGLPICRTGCQLHFPNAQMPFVLDFLKVVLY